MEEGQNRDTRSNWIQAYYHGFVGMPGQWGPEIKRGTEGRGYIYLLKRFKGR